MTDRKLLGERYRILEELGRGSSGRVYRVWDIHLEKEWAVKEMLSESEREVQILKTLSNPHFPRIVDVFCKEDKHYLVMDYLKGITLEDELRKGPMQEAKVIELALLITEALLYLHGFQPPLLYLDLKPSNIMVTESGELCLVDLGSVMEKGERRIISGTFGYASPEQMQTAEGRSIPDERSDMFSLGIIIFCMLTGRSDQLPVVNPNGKSGIMIRRYSPLATPFLEQIVERCTRPVPKRRYCSLREVYQQLSNLKKKRYGFFYSKGGTGTARNQNWQQVKSILYTEGRGRRYITGIGIILGIIAGSLFSNTSGMAKEEKLPVILRDSMTGRKVLVREGCAYETGGPILFELNPENLDEECRIIICCESPKGEIRRFELDCVKK